MPRPQFNRIVHEPPLYSDFKPIGVRAQNLEQIVLTLDEFEAFLKPFDWLINWVFHMHWQPMRWKYPVLLFPG